MRTQPADVAPSLPELADAELAPVPQLVVELAIELTVTDNDPLAAKLAPVDPPQDRSPVVLAQVLFAPADASLVVIVRPPVFLGHLSFPTRRSSDLGPAFETVIV